MITPYEDREQTAAKHQILSRYLSAFVPIVGSWASDISYIDCLAGPWESVDPNLRDTSFARAIEVLRSTRSVLTARGKSPSMRCLFIDKDPVAFAQLKEYCARVSDIEVNPRNWDFTSHIDDVVRFAKERPKSFPFFFIDPTGWEPLQIDLIAPILRMNPGEVLITLMTSWITRFLSDPTKGFHRLLGADLPRILQLEGDDQEAEIVRCYANSVRDAGQFQYVCTLPVLKPDQDAFHYFMIYGTRHPRGVEVFKETEKNVIPFMHETRAQAQERRRSEQSGQSSMFSAETQYREKKFTRFQLKNLELAKCRLRKVLESSDQILFDDAWAAVMQYAAVSDTDLHEWLDEWTSAGLLQITNQQAGRRPRKKQKQYLRWRSSARNISS
jgi:three-Cys-motif partner protein